MRLLSYGKPKPITKLKCLINQIIGKIKTPHLIFPNNEQEMQVAGTEVALTQSCNKQGGGGSQNRNSFILPS